jgi:hypothetical protein
LPAWTEALLPMASCVAEMTAPCHSFFCWDEVSPTFLPELALNHDPPNLHLLSSCNYSREPPRLYLFFYKCLYWFQNPPHGMHIYL